MGDIWCHQIQLFQPCPNPTWMEQACSRNGKIENIQIKLIQIFHVQRVGNFCASSQFINMTQVIASWLSKILRGIKWCWPLPSPIRMSALMISPVRGSTWMWLNVGWINKCPMPNGVADPALASPSLEISSEMDQEIVLYRASALANNMFFADSMTHMTPVSPVRGFSDPDEVVVYRPIIIIRQDCLWERMTREWPMAQLQSKFQWFSLPCILRLDKCRLFEKLEARIPCLGPADFDLNVTFRFKDTSFHNRIAILRNITKQAFNLSSFALRCFYTLLHPAPPPQRHCRIHIDPANPCATPGSGGSVQCVQGANSAKMCKP